MNSLGKQDSIMVLAESLKRKANELANEKIKSQFLENLKFHEDLSKHVYSYINFIESSIIMLDNNLAKNKGHRLKIELKRLSENIKELEKIKYKNITALKKSDIILDILIACEVNNSKSLEEGFKGGHFKINDNGELYEKLQNTNLTKERISSHYGACKENGMVEGKSDRSLTAGKMFSEFLFGFTNNPPATWFQLEAAPLTREDFIETRVQKILNDILETLTTIITLGYSNISLNTIRHGLDWINYAVVNGKQKNIGQYGNSEHTEKKNPLIIENQIEVIMPQDKVSEKVNGKETTNHAPRR